MMLKKILFVMLLACCCPFVIAQSPPGTIPSCPVPTAKIPSGSSITVTWVAPTKFTVGTPIAGAITYNLYSITGTSASQIATGLTTTSSIRGSLNAGSPCYAVTAVVGGVESTLSNTASIQVVDTPSPPTGVTCTLNIPTGGGAVTGSCTTQ